MSKKANRRQFLSLATLGLVGIPLLKSYSALASTCPQKAPKSDKVLAKMLDPESRTGKRLKYVINAADAKKDPKTKYKTGNTFGTCKFYRVGEEIEKHAPCTMAAKKYVPACGWCKSFKPTSKKRA